MCENRIGITFVVFEVKLSSTAGLFAFKFSSSFPFSSKIQLLDAILKKEKTLVFCSKHVSKNHLRLQELIAGSDENWAKRRGGVIID